MLDKCNFQRFFLGETNPVRHRQKISITPQDLQKQKTYGLSTQPHTHTYASENYRLNTNLFYARVCGINDCIVKHRAILTSCRAHLLIVHVHGYPFVPQLNFYFVHCQRLQRFLRITPGIAVRFVAVTHMQLKGIWMKPTRCRKVTQINRT